MPGRIDFTLGFNKPNTGAKRIQDSRYRTYVLGDFSGQTDTPWEQRKITRINIDNFDQVMAQIMPAIDVDTKLRLNFETLDDFHPDICLLKVPILADLLALRQELGNPATAAQAAAKIKAFLPVEDDKKSPNQHLESSETETEEAMLERLLGKKPETSRVETDSVDRLLQRMVSPYVSKEVEPQSKALIKIIDATVSQYLRTLMHRSDFQRLESLWTATAGLVNEESSDEHEFFLIDITREELLAELKSGQQLFEQKLMAHIQTGDGEQEVLLVGDFEFSDSADDKEFLNLCSRLANNCGTFFLAAVDHVLIEDITSGSENTQKWKQYCDQISADHVILAYPSYLLRLPYGNKRDPIEALAFEECSVIPQVDELLWGNPAFLLARVFLRASQSQNNEDIFYFNDIPCFSYEIEGEQRLQAGSKFVMTEAQANALLSQGIMPVIAYHQRQGVRLIAISSL